MLDVRPIPAFRDNYIWMIRGAGDPRRVAVVDPGDARPVRAALAAESLKLEAILATHHHADHVGGVAELADPDWVLAVPWRDRESEEHGFAPSAQSPSIVWPADRAWVWVTEVDDDSTVIGGSAELVAALVADPRLEAFEIPVGAQLTYDSDEVNR